jgi:integrase
LLLCKTKKAIRDIPYDSELEKIFKGILQKGIYVISGCAGAALNLHNWSQKHYGVFYDRLRKLLQKKEGTELELLNPHELRHTFGSILYSRGVDIVIISKLMGHSSVEITVKLYIHDDINLKKKRFPTAKNYDFFTTLLFLYKLRIISKNILLQN